MTVEAIIEQALQLPFEERKALVNALIDTLTEPKKTRSLHELRGLGKEIWQGIDAQDYINQERDEWDKRS